MKYKKKQKRLYTEKTTKNQILMYSGGVEWGGGGGLASPGARLRN